MRSQPVLTDVRYLYKPALHHVPTQKPLQAAQNKHGNKVRHKWTREMLSDPKPDKPDREHQADEPTQHTMRVFEIEDFFERL